MYYGKAFIILNGDLWYENIEDHKIIELFFVGISLVIIDTNIIVPGNPKFWHKLQLHCYGQANILGNKGTDVRINQEAIINLWYFP